jgi:hypothetical protein
MANLPSKIDDEDPIRNLEIYIYIKNVVMGYNIVAKMVNSYKLYMNGQHMKVYMLTIYIIHVECDDIMLSHHLRLDVACN